MKIARAGQPGARRKVAFTKAGGCLHEFTNGVRGKPNTQATSPTCVKRDRGAGRRHRFSSAVSWGGGSSMRHPKGAKLHSHPMAANKGGWRLLGHQQGPRGPCCADRPFRPPGAGTGSGIWTQSRFFAADPTWKNTNSENGLRPTNKGNGPGGFRVLDPQVTISQTAACPRATPAVGNTLNPTRSRAQVCQNAAHPDCRSFLQGKSCGTLGKGSLER